jgi:hypothetical protein
MATHRRFQMTVGLAGMAIGLAGCASTRDDVMYNPYQPNRGNPSVMQSADRLMDAAEMGLGDLDLRLEHALY